MIFAKAVAEIEMAPGPDRNYKDKKKGSLSEVVVKCPVVIFFLAHDVLE